MLCIYTLFTGVRNMWSHSIRRKVVLVSGHQGVALVLELKLANKCKGRARAVLLLVLGQRPLLRRRRRRTKHPLLVPMMRRYRLTI
jgi:hypothetical protein